MRAPLFDIASSGPRLEAKLREGKRAEEKGWREREKVEKDVVVALGTLVPEEEVRIGGKTNRVVGRRVLLCPSRGGNLSLVTGGKGGLMNSAYVKWIPGSSLPLHASRRAFVPRLAHSLMPRRGDAVMRC